MSLVEEFKKTLEPETKSELRLKTALELLKGCREYIFRHWKQAVYGKYQKTWVDVLDEFIKDCEEEK